MIWPSDWSTSSLKRLISVCVCVQGLMYLMTCILYIVMLVRTQFHRHLAYTIIIQCYAIVNGSFFAVTLIKINAIAVSKAKKKEARTLTLM